MPVKVGLQYIELWQESMEDVVREKEKEEYPEGQIVFYGPSYFTRWGRKHGFTPMREVLLGKSGAECVVNRGFGSSCSEHQLYYYPRMVRPLKPSVLVYECFGNAGAFGYTLEERWEIAQRVIAYALTDFPGIRIYLCSPHNSRDQKEEDVEKKRLFSEWQKEFAEKIDNVFFLDILNYEPLQSRKDIYVEDGVHFNAEGYEIYGEMFKKMLRNELDRY